MKTTKYLLFSSFAEGLPMPSLGFKVVNAIEREDGSNHRYNVKGITEAGETKTMFVQTVD